MRRAAPQAKSGEASAATQPTSSSHPYKSQVPSHQSKTSNKNQPAAVAVGASAIGSGRLSVWREAEITRKLCTQMVGVCEREVSFAFIFHLSSFSFIYLSFFFLIFNCSAGT